MLKKEEALSYGLSFDGTYQDAPFHDDNWQLVRVKENKKAFLWVYEKDGYVYTLGNIAEEAQYKGFFKLCRQKK